MESPDSRIWTCQSPRNASWVVDSVLASHLSMFLCNKCIFILFLQCSYVVQPCNDATYNLPTIQFPHIPGKCYFDQPKSDNIILSKPPLPPALEYVKIFGFLAAGIFLIVFIWNCGHMVGLPALDGAPGPAQPTTTAEGAVIGGQVVSIMVT